MPARPERLVGFRGGLGPGILNHCSHASLTRSNTNEFGIALPAGGLAYTAAPKNYGLWPPEQGGRNATFQEIGVNSAGVAVSDTETIFNSEAALAVDPYVEDTGLTEDVLTAMLIPQVWRGLRGRGGGQRAGYSRARRSGLVGDRLSLVSSSKSFAAPAQILSFRQCKQRLDPTFRCRWRFAAD